MGIEIFLFFVNNEDIMTKIVIVKKMNYLINVIIILFFSFVIVSTTNEICNSYQAREFIEKAQYLPMIPWKIPVYATIYMFLLGLSNVIKGKLINSESMWIIVFLIIDILLAITIVFYLNFSYRGIFLLLITNILYYSKKNIHRIALLGLMLLLYIFLDYDILSNRLSVFSINEYINYYSNESRFYIQGAKNILISLNDIGFILFIFFLLQNKIHENTEIRQLNTQLKTTATELELANLRLREYAKESVNNVKMKERNRLAREIHDILGHSLTSLTTGIEACISMVDSNPILAQKQLNNLLELSRKGLIDVRRSVRELKIDSLSKYDLIPAIKKLITDINECTPVVVELMIHGTILKMKQDEEETIYRIIQETITNAIRHGKASRIEVGISFIGHSVQIIIQDNGNGCEKVDKGFGLTHIEERVNMLSGTVSYGPQKSRGFTVNIDIPIRWGTAYD